MTCPGNVATVSLPLYAEQVFIHTPEACPAKNSGGAERGLAPRIERLRDKPELVWGELTVGMSANVMGLQIHCAIASAPGAPRYH